MKVLVAVYSHSGDSVNGNHDKIRQTWGKHLSPWDLRFMIGHRGAPDWKIASDEVLLERANRACGDDWLLWNLYYQEMTIEMLRWSLEQGYDFTFLCCNDTFIVPSKLRATDFAKYDCSGVFYPDRALLGETFDDPFYKRPAYVAPDAGTGWFMSRKASELVVNSNQSEYFGTSDQYVGQVLGPLIKSGEITAKILDEFHHVAAWHYREEGIIDPVIQTGYPVTSNWMREMYQKFGG
jgi:hypothetical protein